MGRREEWTWTARDGLRLHGVGWRPDAEPPAGAVLLVHGMGEHIGRYEHVAAAIAGAGYACVGFDLRGHGRSGGRRGDAESYEHLLDDVDLALTRLREYAPDVPAFVWAHSYGGAIALNYAIRRRPGLAGMVVTGPWLRLAFEPPAWKLAVGQVFRRVWPSFTMKRGIRSGRLTRIAEAEADAMSDPLNHGVISARSFFGAKEHGLRALREADGLPSPILLMHGGDDQVTDAGASRELADRLGERCTFRLYEGMAHELHNDWCKDEMLGEALRWLDERTRELRPELAAPSDENREANDLDETKENCGDATSWH
ncbi:alpha/beta fold hydrolase [Paenibacillus thermoaerophilus]|uniref:Alpha/beta fold hydrolase n=1 Tax=Paenibacillus thermoaerophilus TaxID=1215385 RepID=A0ABW2UZG7_9BACL|nr:alpha/beta fold hydrolase [Paenibacillus thermoaerophilus]TMV14380.1 alpha/beta hydrolase [Paenibacillus thermoaerophilus]